MLQITSIYPSFLITAIALAFAHLVARRVPFYRDLLAVPSRFPTLDGLRGFLALGVFFTHAICHNIYARYHVWASDRQPYYSNLGARAVFLFFLISGFLFWSKAIGNGGRLPARTLYPNRVRRIVPMHAATSVLVLAIALLAAEPGRAHEPPLRVAGQIARLFGFGVFTPQTLDGVYLIPITAGVTWTLRFEWFFYLALPFLAFAAASVFRLVLLAIVVVATILLMSHRLPPAEHPVSLFLHFLYGMGLAQLLARVPTFAPARWPVVTIFSILLLIPFTLTAERYAHPAGVLVFCTFLYGNDLFGLLTSPAARLLGTVSYSLYLLHAPVLFVVMRTADARSPIADMAPLPFWGLTALAAVTSVLLSLVTYRYIEHPFLSRRRPTPSADPPPP